VKVKSLCVIGGDGGRAPAHVAAWTNRDDIDFSNCEAIKPVQEWDLPEDRRGELEHPMRAAKFSGVHSLTLFFSRNYGADSTRIFYIGLKGDFTPVRSRPLCAGFAAADA
jgi:hypothetical protein